MAALVRHHDRDRFQTVLFAPAARREALFALYAFNYEIASVRERVSQPTLGRIRLEWWRENVGAAYGNGPVRYHPVVEALTAVIREVGLTQNHFELLIEAREADFDDEPPTNLAALEDYAEGTSSRLIYLALEVLGVRHPSASRAGYHVGVAYALAGLLRALPLRTAASRLFIPAEVASRNGLEPGNPQQMRGSTALRRAVAEIGAAAEAHLRSARGIRNAVPQAALPAVLPAVIADRSLRWLKRAGYDPFAPGLARRDPLQSWRLAGAALRKRF
ncbi:MAG TPA: phytoene/squalene synthase family protein [Stellaceae bacterium]|nr:phytoene/squalene synthase family protein [Stellaceae bacterium]